MSRRIRVLSLITAAALVAAGCSAASDVEVTGTDDLQAATTEPSTEPTDTTEPTTDTTEPTTDPSTEPSTEPTTDPTVPEDPVPVSDYSYEEVKQLALEEVPAFWREQFPLVYGSDYEELAGGVWALTPDTTDRPFCGTDDRGNPYQITYDDVRGNAFFAGICDIVAFDDSELMPFIYEEFGPLVVATVFAHEWGHAIQFRAGVNELSIYMELQADCFAGAWTRSMSDDGTGLQFHPDELTTAIAGLLFVRDPVGVVDADDTDEGQHGLGFDRASAFRDGYNNGTAHCATYPDNPPPVFEYPFLDETDAANQGNAPYEELLTGILLPTLDEFWGEVYEFNNLEYAPLAGGLVPYGDGVGEPPACGDAALDSDFYQGNIFYCPDGDFIAFDEPGLIFAVYSAIGDNSAGVLIGNAFAERVQQQLGIGLEGKDRSLQADCLSGAWMRDIMEKGAADPVNNPQLSPGDLDEAVITFLEFSDSAEPGAPQQYGTPFERLDQLRGGLLGDLPACGL